MVGAPCARLERGTRVSSVWGGEKMWARAGAGSWMRGSWRAEAYLYCRRCLWVYCVLEGMMRMVLKAVMTVEVQCEAEQVWAWASNTQV